MRALLLWVAALIPATAVVFLVTSGFLVSWRGVVASRRPPAADEPRSYTVLIVDDDDYHEREFPAALVESLKLPVQPSGLPPATLAEGLPQTVKTRFQLQYHVTLADGTTTSVPTTTPQSVGVSVLFFLLALFLRNMMYSGSPFSIAPRGVTLPKAQAPAGAPAPSRRSRRNKKGPPPSKPRRGRR